MILKRLSINDKLFFFERNFFTLDGLWMVETEKETNWETALNIDLVVWKKLLKIIFRRLKKYLNIKADNLRDFIKILTFRWAVEGWNYELAIRDQGRVEISIRNCPYYASMDRNPDRHDKIPLICKNFCIPFYESIVNEFNNRIKIKRTRYKGLGDITCDFIFRQKGHSSSKLQSKVKRLSKRRINDKDKLFYFAKNFRTLDGLWIIEVENQINFETALKIDTTVWQKLYGIIFRRVMKYLNIQGNSLKNLIKILSFIWNCEGNIHQIVKKTENEITLSIVTCPYIEAMRHNPEHYKRISSICKDMCVSYLDPVIKGFNPNIVLKRENFIGMGDKSCDFHFSLK
ncbi:MAG: DUF6125 family protein [Promethearchaeota archaeon]